MHPCHVDTQRKKLNLSWVRSQSGEFSTLLGRAWSGGLATRILLVKEMSEARGAKVTWDGSPEGSRAMVLKQG